MANSRLLLVFTAPAKSELPVDWCDHEHLPAYVAGAVPSVQSCTRWAAADNKTPAVISLYDLRLSSSASSSSSGPASPSSQHSSSEDEEDSQPSTPTTPAAFGDADEITLDWKYVSLVEVELARGTEREFHRWFDEEHVPLLARVPGWRRSRRFRLEDVV
ncbi:uncharacterized protein BXZ73DRAFT_45779, partial [Epithele typhae]|uniref:uncharacterized protein n=1 Tax=Epithele typhae TaxID=378194 RepID=UPI0020083732